MKKKKTIVIPLKDESLDLIDLEKVKKFVNSLRTSKGRIVINANDKNNK